MAQVEHRALWLGGIPELISKFLVGNVLSLAVGVDEVRMKPHMAAAPNERDQKRGPSTCLTNARSSLKDEFDCRKKRDPHSDDLLSMRRKQEIRSLTSVPD